MSAGVARAPISAYAKFATSRSPRLRLPPLPLRQRPHSPHALLRLRGDMRSGRLECHSRPMHPYGMEGRGWIGRNGFWLLALLWLPAGVAAQAVVRFLPARRSLPVAGGADRSGITAPGCALRPAARARLPTALAAALPARGLARRDRAGGRHRRGIAGGGPARSGGDRCLCGGTQPAGVGRVVVAGAARLTTDGGGPAAQQAGPPISERERE